MNTLSGNLGSCLHYGENYQTPFPLFEELEAGMDLLKLLVPNLVELYHGGWTNHSGAGAIINKVLLSLLAGLRRFRVLMKKIIENTAYMLFIIGFSALTLNIHFFYTSIYKDFIFFFSFISVLLLLLSIISKKNILKHL